MFPFSFSGFAVFEHFLSNYPFLKLQEWWVNTARGKREDKLPENVADSGSCVPLYKSSFNLMVCNSDRAFEAAPIEIAFGRHIFIFGPFATATVLHSALWTR